ncbi:MAG TPA: hypothetical protein VFD43_01175 [Planctomycetota bacterium]|nr:hypothetical protein [Planctomycetota bacterium]
MLQLLGEMERFQALSSGDETRSKARSAAERIQELDGGEAVVGAPRLDLLWGEFFATGRYAAVRKIVGALSLAPFEPDVGRYIRSAKSAGDMERGVKGMSFMAARWSLDSNMKQHPLVLGYVRYAAEHEQLGKDELEQGRALLAKYPEASGPPQR